MPPAESPSADDTADYAVIAQSRAASVPRRQRWIAFALVAAASLAVGAVLAAHGAWPVLPYSVLEVALVAAAFALVERRARTWERLTVQGDRVIVERSAGGRCDRREFNRWWLRVDLEAAGRGREPRLTLRFAGEAMDFGGALPPGRRAEVARTLRRLTAPR